MDAITLERSGPSENGYTVQRVGACTIIYGAVPISDFTRLTRGQPKTAVMDSAMARRLDATFVVGTPAALDDLRRMGLPFGARFRAELDRARSAGLSEQALAWLCGDERGMSSDAIFSITDCET